MVTDNGTQFTSSQFAEFCRINGIEHVRTPPYHMQSNGQVERFVDTFKRALVKAQGEGSIEEILHTFLITYRRTPHPRLPENKSPAELMFGRNICTPWDIIRPQREIQQSKSAVERTKERFCSREFSVGDLVYARRFCNNQQSWAAGKVRARLGTVMYEVMVGNDFWVRHVNQLRRRTANDKSTDHSEPSLPLEIICDTFDISNPSGPVEGTTPKKHEFDTKFDPSTSSHQHGRMYTT